MNQPLHSYKNIFFSSINNTVLDKDAIIIIIRYHNTLGETYTQLDCLNSL